MSEDRAEYNQDRDWENIEFTAVTVGDYTIHMGSGTETATTKYLNKGNLGTGFVLRPGDTVNIVQINNKVLRDPITCGEDVTFAVSKHIPDIHTIVIRTTIANTEIKLLVT